MQEIFDNFGLIVVIFYRSIDNEPLDRQQLKSKKLNFDTFWAIWKIRHTTPFLEFSIVRHVTICAFRDMSDSNFSTRHVTKMQKHYRADHSKIWESKSKPFWYFTETAQKWAFLNRSDNRVPEFLIHKLIRYKYIVYIYSFVRTSPASERRNP